MFRTTIDMMEKSVAMQAQVVTELAGRVQKLEDTRLEATIFWEN